MKIKLRKEIHMKSKVEFYKNFFQELEKKGFAVDKPSSPDYIADIIYKKKTIAFFTKADLLEANPFETVSEKQLETIMDIARATANLCGICKEKPYDEEKVKKMANGIVKINEHNDVVLACKEHPLLGYVMSTYKQDAENQGKPIQRLYFYDKQSAFESFAIRSGLVDERKMFSEDELRILHKTLIQYQIAEKDISTEDTQNMDALVDHLEDIIPELHKEEKRFDVSRLINALSLGSER